MATDTNHTSQEPKDTTMNMRLYFSIDANIMIEIFWNHNHEELQLDISLQQERRTYKV